MVPPLPSPKTLIFTAKLRGVNENQTPFENSRKTQAFIAAGKLGSAVAPALVNSLSSEQYCSDSLILVANRHSSFDGCAKQMETENINIRPVRICLMKIMFSLFMAKVSVCIKTLYQLIMLVKKANLT